MKDFFDFYILEALSNFCGENSLNHQAKIDRIEKLTDETVERFYKKIVAALKYSVGRELRHVIGCSGVSSKKRAAALSDEEALEMNSLYNRFSYLSTENVIEFYDKQCPKRVYFLFQCRVWDATYGGKKWAKAAKLLINLPKNRKEKLLFIDYALDLFHNSGHLLNKTEFKVLSDRKTYKQRGRWKNALNYRKNATLEELARHSSTKVRNLYIANKLQLGNIV